MDSVLEDVKRLTLGPGDALVLKVPSELPHDQLAIVQDEMRHAFPGHRMLILAGDITVEVVPAAEEPA
jgi:hypothetical protein